MARRPQLEVIRERHELARLSLGTRKLEHALMQYDAVRPSKARRQVVPERGDEDKVLPAHARSKATVIGRDLERNDSAARAIINQFRVNVVGSLGKLQVNAPEGEQAAKWFNGTWAKAPDYRDDGHWSDMLQHTVSAVIREGDCLVVVDDGLIEDSGKLLIWESDQICNLSEAAFKASPWGADGNIQENGIIRDRVGRVLAYIVTGQRGRTVIDKIEDATIYSRGAARLVKNPWRANQGRGIGSILTPANNFADLYDILARELQTAKVAATLAGKVRRKDAVTDYDDPTAGPEYLPENSGQDAATVAAAGANNATDSTAPNYERFEALTGGIMEYMSDEDDFELLAIDRPNVALKDFTHFVLGMAGASMGLARCYTLMQASTSYTAFRGEMIMSWATFYALQKWLERSVADWVAVKVLTWAQRSGKIDAMAAGWENALSWIWPRMPSVDELKEAMAVKQQLKNGTVDFSGLLGPDWGNIHIALAEQLRLAKERGLPLSVFETASGNTSSENREDQNEQD